MGLQIGEIVPRRAIEFSELRDKTVFVDAFNTLFQFLTTIRQPDGTPLMDKSGRVTSHLSGLFYRNINLMLEGLRLVYVFDGKPPEKKYQTRKNREEVKEKASEMYEQAVQERDIEMMGKYARQTTRVTSEMIEESKKLLMSMGIAIVQAPGEGEAQAAFLARNDKAYVASQDYDSLLFGAPSLVQNLTLARRRKTVSGYIYISPEMIELERVINNLQVNMDQLICLGILVGTDYNPGGVRGIGPKKALLSVKQYKEPGLIFKAFEERIREQENSFDWQEIFELFKKPDVDNIHMSFPKRNDEAVKRILLDADFSEERIDSQLEKLEKKKEEGKQKDLKSFFG